MPWSAKCCRFTTQTDKSWIREFTQYIDLMVSNLIYSFTWLWDSFFRPSEGRNMDGEKRYRHKGEYEEHAPMGLAAV